MIKDCPLKNEDQSHPSTAKENNSKQQYKNKWKSNRGRNQNQNNKSHAR